MLPRRRFVHSLSYLGFAGILLGRKSFADDLILTPTQNRGPFYPIPTIEEQEHFDVDLTKKGSDSPVALGKVIAIRGNVVDISGELLNGVTVEVWQACESGRYDHPNDKGTSTLDPNFQYWGRMQTGVDGSFAFKTIQPGKYPGRTPHIHFRVVAPKRDALETQLYFAQNEALNAKDGIYTGVPSKQQQAITTALENLAANPKAQNSAKLPTGTFQIVLGPKKDIRSTPGM